jgi:hypothetical protein
LQLLLLLLLGAGAPCRLAQLQGGSTTAAATTTCHICERGRCTACLGSAQTVPAPHHCASLGSWPTFPLHVTLHVTSASHQPPALTASTPQIPPDAPPALNVCTFCPPTHAPPAPDYVPPHTPRPTHTIFHSLKAVHQAHPRLRLASCYP